MRHPRQDSTYHGLCYTSRGALAGTRTTVEIILQLKTEQWERHKVKFSWGNLENIKQTLFQISRPR